MPAREMFFTFNTKVKVNKETVRQFVEDFRDEIEDYFQEIKGTFGVDAIDTKFLKEFIKELKGFDSVSLEAAESWGKERIIRDFIRGILGDEERDPTTVLGIRYLYDEWDYEGCGREDYYYYTYTDDVKMAKKTIKEVVKLVKKLGDLGVKAELNIEYDGKN
jgi:hypothetical protein